MWNQLPSELKTKIFLFDRTRKLDFDKVLLELEMKPVHIQLKKICRQSPIGMDWKKYVFMGYHYVKRRQQWEIDADHQANWEDYLYLNFKRTNYSSI